MDSRFIVILVYVTTSAADVKGDTDINDVLCKELPIPADEMIRNSHDVQSSIPSVCSGGQVNDDLPEIRRGAG